MKSFTHSTLIRFRDSAEVLTTFYFFAVGSSQCACCGLVIILFNQLGRFNRLHLMRKGKRFLLIISK